jgi:hypothetical protein
LLVKFHVIGDVFVEEVEPVVVHVFFQGLDCRRHVRFSLLFFFRVVRVAEVVAEYVVELLVLAFVLETDAPLT